MPSCWRESPHQYVVFTQALGWRKRFKKGIGQNESAKACQCNIFFNRIVRNLPEGTNNSPPSCLPVSDPRTKVVSAILTGVSCRVPQVFRLTKWDRAVAFLLCGASFQISPWGPFVGIPPTCSHRLNRADI
jgi:hypothetical protein